MAKSKSAKSSSGKSKPLAARQSQILMATFMAAGATGFALQFVWIRRLSLIYGAAAPTIFASAIAFFLSLAAGPLMYRKYADRITNRARTYGLMLGAIGAYAIVSPIILRLLGLIESGIGGHIPWMLRAPEQFIFSLITIGAPAVVMGALYPAIVDILHSDEGISRTTGSLIGIHIIGAAVGIAVTGYLIMPGLGELGTIIVMASLNILLAIFVIYYLPSGIEAGPQAVESQTHEETSRGMVWFTVVVLAFTAVSCAGYFAYWSRTFVLMSGGSVYGSVTMQSIIMFGIGLGCVTFANLASRFKSPALALGVVQLALAITALLSAPVLASYLSSTSAATDVVTGFGSQVARQCLRILSVAFFPAFMVGASYSLVLHITTVKPGKPRRVAGRLYAMVVVAGAIGYAAALFGLMPAVGLQNGILISAALSCAFGILLSLIVQERLGWIAFMIGALIFGGLLVPASKSWDIYTMASGAYFKVESDPNTPPSTSNATAENVPYFKDGFSATVMVIRNRAQKINSLLVNGEPLSSTRHMDMLIDVMMGHTPLMLASDSPTVAVIGLGTGVTAGAVAAHIGSRIYCAELYSSIIPAISMFSLVNHDLRNMPKAEIVADDGRHFLATRRRATFDVIISGRIGIDTEAAGSLYSEQYYNIARSRLKPGGIFCRWIPLSHLSRGDLRSIIATFLKVYPDAVMGMAFSDAMLMGSNGGVLVDMDQLENRFATDAVSGRDLRSLGIGSGTELAGRLLLGPAGLGKLVAGAGIITDNRPRLEFSAPRSKNLNSAPDNWRWLMAAIQEDTSYIKGNEEAIKRFNGARAAAMNVINAGYLAYEGKYDDAARLYADAIRAQPENLSARMQLSDLILQSVTGLMARDKYSEARATVYRALDIYEDNPNALQWMAHSAAKTGDFAYARNLLDRAITVKPNDPGILTDLALALYGLDRYPEAFENIQKAIALEPDNSRAYTVMGVILEKSNKAGSAQAYAKAISLDPANDEARKRLEAMNKR